jgi:hypothetical protein
MYSQTFLLVDLKNALADLQVLCYSFFVSLCLCGSSGFYHNVIHCCPRLSNHTGLPLHYFMMAFICVRVWAYAIVRSLSGCVRPYKLQNVVMIALNDTACLALYSRSILPAYLPLL